MKVFQGEETIKIVSAGNESTIRYDNSLKEGKDKHGLIHTSACGSAIITKWIKSNQNTCMVIFFYLHMQWVLLKLQENRFKKRPVYLDSLQRNTVIKVPGGFQGSQGWGQN